MKNRGKWDMRAGSLRFRRGSPAVGGGGEGGGVEYRGVEETRVSPTNVWRKVRVVVGEIAVHLWRRKVVERRGGEGERRREEREMAGRGEVGSFKAARNLSRDDI